MLDATSDSGRRLKRCRTTWDALRNLSIDGAALSVFGQGSQVRACRVSAGGPTPCHRIWQTYPSMPPKRQPGARSSASEMLRTLVEPSVAKRHVVESVMRNAKSRLRPAVRPEPHYWRIDVGLFPCPCGPHQFHRKPAKGNQARHAGKGRHAQVLTRSVLACGCAPRAASGLPLPASLVRLIPCCLPRRNSCEPMHGGQEQDPALQSMCPDQGFASGFWFGFNHFVLHKGD
jgi:hypothetical protein